MSARFHPYLCGRNAAEWLIDMTRQGLTEYIAAIRGANRAVMDAARRRQAELAKPPGSLGRLEDYSVRMVGITGEVKPTLEKCRVLVLRRTTASWRRGSRPRRSRSRCSRC